MEHQGKLFPTFSRWWRILWDRAPGEDGLDNWFRRYSPWLSTPWWISDTVDSKQRGLIRMLKTAASERLAMQPLIEGLAREDRGWYRRRLRRLTRSLARGGPLADSLERSAGVVTDEQLLAVRFGEQSGTLARSLGDLLTRNDPNAETMRKHIRQLYFYGTTLLTIGFLIVSFILIKIVPSFQAIFDDFDLELPRPSLWFINSSIFFVNYWFLFVLPLIVLLWLVRSEVSRKWFRRNVFSRFLPPVVRLRVAELLNLLAVSVEAGRPMPGAISTLARYHYDAFLRQKLLFVRNEMEQGADLWQSLATARLLTPAESNALAIADSADTRCWVMRQLADLRRGRIMRALSVCMSLLQPLAVLCFAAIVLLIALGCLAPLVSLTEGLSG